MAHSEREMDHTLELEFDGKAVQMVPFVKEIICNVVLGIARTMRGFTDDSEIKIVIKKNK